MKTVLILRGLPGSGKTTLTEKIWNEAYKRGNLCVVCSADEWFLSPVYRNYATKLWSTRGHHFCEMKFNTAIREDVPLIVIDNVNREKSNFERYIDDAVIGGYATRVCRVGGFDEESVQRYIKRGKVPEAVVRRNIEKWQPYPGERLQEQVLEPTRQPVLWEQFFDWVNGVGS